MKKFFFRILFISAFIFLCYQLHLFSRNIPSESKDLAIKLMSYNIHHANPPECPDFIDLDAIIRTIKEQVPDIVALQEVDVNTIRSGPFNQAEEIAHRLGMNYFFAKAINYDGGEYGVAILSKFPISDTKVFRLPTKQGTNGEPRVLAVADIIIGDGRAIKFGSTHLDAQMEDINRLLQMREIAKMSEKLTIPFIIAGDFNAVAESEVIEIMDSHFTRTCNTCPFTIPANNPTKAIDFIAYRDPGYSIEVNSSHIVAEPYASDHLPLVAEFEIN